MNASRVFPGGSRIHPFPAPSDFPSSIRISNQTFRNWSGEICVDALWTCARTNHDDVVILVGRA
jgi:hypothetical protein